ncbi:MAG TPA: ABC transporter substrate-binding protein [Chloroflexota bacterium]
MRALGAAGLLAFLLAACGGSAAPASAPTSAAAGKPEKDHIKLLYATASGEQTFMELASQKGFFQKYGLTVDVEYAQGNTGIASLSSGEAQMDMADGVTAIESTVAGNPLKVIAVFDKTSPYMIAALPEVNSVADLKGKAVAVGKLGDTSDVSMRIALKDSGLTPGKDFTIQQIGNSPARWAALSSKQVPAAILDEEAYAKQATDQGMHILVNLHQQKLPYVASALVLTPAFAQQNPNTVVASLRGMMDGVAYFADEKNKAEVTALMGKLLRTEGGDAKLEEIYQAYHTRPSTDPTPDRQGMDSVIGAMKQIDPQRYGSITTDQVIDPSFMAKLKP